MTQAHVFAGIDSSYLNKSVTDYASWIASTVATPLTLLHNIELANAPIPSDFSGSIGLGTKETLLDELIELESRRNRLLIEQGNELLSRATDNAKSNDVDNIACLQRHGSLTETLIDLEDQIRVLVLGTRGEDHGENSHQLGRQIESIIRALHKPILVVNKPFSQPKRLLLAYDGSEAANKALDWLSSSPLYKDMTCHLVHVCTTPDKGKEVLVRAETVLSSAGISVKSAVITGDVLTELLKYQQQERIDLMVMGSFGHSRLREMVWGSLTLKMLTSSRIPLLLLR